MSVLIRTEDEPVGSRLELLRHIAGESLVPYDIRPAVGPADLRVDFSDQPTEREGSDLWSDVADMFATRCIEDRLPEDAVALPVGHRDGVDAATLAAFRAESANGIGAPMSLRS